jgi:DNA-directed RNA polymerase subunit RPC12/RpoP
MTIEFSIETLYHFRCTNCLRWWSVGDFQVQQQLTCPFCSMRSVLVQSEEMKNDQNRTEHQPIQV